MSNSTQSIERLKSIEVGFSSIPNIPEDLSSYSTDLTKSNLTQFISSIIVQAETLEEISYEIDPVTYSFINGQLASCEVYVNQHLKNGPSHIPAFLTHIFNIKNVYNSIISSDSSKSGISAKFNKALNTKLSESLAQTRVINNQSEKAETLIASLEAYLGKTSSLVDKTQNDAVKIEERERTTSTSSTKIVELEQKSISLFKELEEIKSSINTQNNNIKDQQEELNNLSKNLKEKITEAQDLLEDANRVGLAGAFKTRRDELNTPIGWWIGLFIASIITLIVFSFITVSKSGPELDWHYLLYRIPLSAPIIWLAWFSARQYGFKTRIQEDYSFKVASAMSFHGYKNEIQENSVLTEKLQSIAIENFGNNPLRIYNDNNNHGSPIQELLNKLPNEKIIELLGEALKKTKP